MYLTSLSFYGINDDFDPIIAIQQKDVIQYFIFHIFYSLFHNGIVGEISSFRLWNICSVAAVCHNIVVHVLHFRPHEKRISN